MKLSSIVRTLAAAALVAAPSIAMAAPDQNTSNNGCPNGHWVNGQCVYNTNGNGQWNNGRWNNNGHRDRDRDRDDRDRDHRNGSYNNGSYNNGSYNNGRYNNGGYNNGSYNNGYGYGNGGYGGNGTLTATVSSFSPYNLYLNNGIHVELHNGTVINPTGSNLSPGMRVRVIGNRNADGTFNANEIDVIGNGGYRY